MTLALPASSKNRTEQPFFTCEIPERSARRKPVLSLYLGVFHWLACRAVAGGPQGPVFALCAPTRQPSPAPPAKAGGARRDRTDDLMLAKHALSQLSYGPFFWPQSPALASARLAFAPSGATAFGLASPSARWAAVREREQLRQPRSAIYEVNGGPRKS